jgi:hypothetical protein
MGHPIWMDEYHWKLERQGHPPIDVNHDHFQTEESPTMKRATPVKCVRRSCTRAVLPDHKPHDHGNHHQKTQQPDHRRR